MVTPRFRRPRSWSCFSSGRAVMRAHACSSDLAPVLAENAGANLAPSRSSPASRFCAARRMSPPAPARPIAVDQFDHATTGLTGAREFTIQMLQGLLDSGHARLEVDRSDFDSSSVVATIILSLPPSSTLSSRAQLRDLEFWRKLNRHMRPRCCRTADLSPAGRKSRSRSAPRLKMTDREVCFSRHTVFRHLQ